MGINRTENTCLIRGMTMKKWQFRSLSQRINVIFTFLVISVMLIISGVAIFHLIRQVNKDYQSSVEQQLELFDYHISLYTENIEANTRMLAEMPLFKEVDSRITSYVDKESETGLIPMLPYENSHYEQEVFMVLETFRNAHVSVKNASVGVQINGGFLKSPPSPRFNEYDARERTWYKAAIAAPKAVTLSGIYTTSTDEKVILSVTTIHDEDDKVVGVITIDFDLKELSETIGKVKIGTDGYVILIDGGGNILAHPKDPDVIGKSLTDSEFYSFISDGKVVVKKQQIEFDGQKYRVEIIPSKLASFPLYYVVVIAEQEYFDNAVLMVAFVKELR